MLKSHQGDHARHPESRVRQLKQQAEAADSCQNSASGASVLARLDAPTMAGRKKESYWAQYQSLLVRRPYFMNITQGGLLAAAGTAAAQTLTEGTVKAQPLIEQVLLTMCFISPVVSMWVPYLGRLRLHWAKATAVDQVCLIGRSLGLGVGVA